MAKIKEAELKKKIKRLIEKCGELADINIELSDELAKAKEQLSYARDRLAIANQTIEKQAQDVAFNAQRMEDVRRQEQIAESKLVVACKRIDEYEHNELELTRQLSGVRLGCQQLAKMLQQVRLPGEPENAHGT